MRAWFFFPLVNFTTPFTLFALTICWSFLSGSFSPAETLSPHANFFDHISCHSVYSEGGRGFLVFEWIIQDGRPLPPGGFNANDTSAFEVLKEVIVDSNITAAIEWILEPGHLTYALNRLPSIVLGTEAGWGVIRPDLSLRPAAHMLSNLFHGLQQYFPPVSEFYLSN